MATVEQAKKRTYANMFESPKYNSGDSKVKPRVGKTRKDRASGAAARRLSNLDARASWRNTGNSRRTVKDFPFHTCNGKKNRTQVTGRGNTHVTYTYSIK